MTLIDSKSNNKRLSEDERAILKNELRNLLYRMDSNQIRQFLFISATRNIVFTKKEVLQLSDNKKIHYLNHLLFSISLNCILYFHHNHPDINLDVVRALVIDLEYNRLPVIDYPIYKLPGTDNIYSNYHSIATGNYIEFFRYIIRNRVSRKIQKHAKVIDDALSLSTELTHSLNIAINLVHKRRSSAMIMLKDASTVLNGTFNYYDNLCGVESYEKAFLAFITELKMLNGEYWADWFIKLFRNSFIMDENNVEAIISLARNTYKHSIAESSSYLSAYISENTESNEVRLMILGGKGEGKTSFVKRFKELSAKMPEGFESTEGIDIDQLMSHEISENIRTTEIDENYRDILIRIWDFAGHEVTHAAHKFFLSDRCIYVVVCQARQVDIAINSKIEYWLEHIRDYAKGIGIRCNSSKIFILINEWDENRPRVNEKSIRTNYPEYDLVFHYINIAKDNQEYGKLDVFRHELLSYINVVDSKIAACYKQIQEKINMEFEKSNYITVKDIYHIIDSVRESGVKIPHANEVVLNVLHSLAICFCII